MATNLTYTQRIDAYLTKLKSEGRKIPESFRRIGHPDFTRISVESEVSVISLHNDTSTRRRLLEGVQELGLGYDPPIRRILTYKDLLEMGSSLRKKELIGKGSSEAQLANTRTALNKFVKGVGKTLEDEVGSELLDEKTWQKVAGNIKNADSKRKFLNELNRWVEYYRGVLKDLDLPEDFSSALREAITRYGRPIRAIANLTGINESTIGEWRNGRNHPAIYRLSDVSILERTLELLPSSLLSRIKKGRDTRFCSEDYPEAVTVDGELVKVWENKHLVENLRPLLPDDFNKRPMSEREEMVVWLIKNLIGPTTEWGHHNKKLVRQSYKLRSNHSLFQMDDLRDAGSMLLKLRNAASPLSEHLKSLLPPKTQSLIKEYDSSGPDPEKLQKMLVNGLNSLLKRPSLFNEQYFAHIKISEETKNLIARGAQGDDLIHLNRLLLEEAFPHEIINRPKFSQSLEREWNELAAHKLGKIPPDGLRRREGSRWEPATEESVKTSTARFFGFLALPVNSDDLEMRGPGLNPDTFCLAMFASVQLASAWLRWMAKRRFKSTQNESDEEQEKVSEVYTELDASYTCFLASLFAPDTGWLRQRRDLMESLREIPGYIDKSFISRAKKNWNKFCNEVHAAYTNLAENLEASAQRTRDSFERILPILESEKPLVAMRDFARNIWEDIPNGPGAHRLTAVRRRNHLIVKITGITALRSKNIRQLLIAADNKGELRFEDGKWIIEISWRKFKNKHSSFFGKREKHNYKKILPDVDGLYDQIEEYIRVYRPILLAGRNSNVFFVSGGKRPLLSNKSFHKLYRNLTMIYIAYNPYLKRGIPGVKPHGPHAARDIMATHVLKETGSIDAAAFSIQDVKETVELHYGRFLPKDKIHFVDNIVYSAFS